MTNDVYCIGLTRTELQTLRVLLPATFPILSAEPDALDAQMIVPITHQARCIVLNPKRLTRSQLADVLCAQEALLTSACPVPIVLFSAPMTQQHEIPLPEYPISVIDLHKRIDRSRAFTVKLLRESSLPCWQGRRAPILQLTSWRILRSAI